MAPLEPWEKVLLDVEAYGEDAHSQLACTNCHGGESAPEKETAHTGLIRDPSSESDMCASCHKDIVDPFDDSLHATQRGYWTAIDARTTPENHPPLEEMFGNHCASCHTTCGDCHVSQPKSVGGGFIDGHVFKETPSMTRNCTACHGSRVGNEYLGKHEDIKADVHFRQGRMQCSDCHTASEMHGDYANADGSLPDHRYDGASLPSCSDCHATVGTADDEIQMHGVHGDKLSCQVCHSVSYTSCDGCHVAVSEESGNPFFRTEGDYQTFYIGRNTLQSEDRPAEFVPVRHIPIATTSYEYYGENLLPNFDSLPTWAYATPHNIQRETPQNASCEACHGNADIFLTADKVAPGELNANQGVIVEAPPPVLGEINTLKPLTLPATHLGFSEDCLVCHLSGVENVPIPPDDHAEYTNEDCSKCHNLP